MLAGSIVCFTIVIVQLGFPDGGAAQATKSAHDLHKETLSFGIDSQILALLATMTQDGDATLNSEVEALVSGSNNPDVRKASIDLLRKVKDWNEDDAVRKILSDHIDNGIDPSDQLIISAIEYLRDAADPNATPLFAKLADDTSTGIAAAAIDAIGHSKDPSSVSGMLISNLKNTSYPTPLKAQTILAVGMLKLKDAVPVLTSILRNKDADITLRRYACNSLGEIGDPASIPVIQKALGDSDTYLRAYAVTAIANYPGQKVDQTLIQALKDSFWRVRTAAAASLGTRRVTNAIPILEYKAKFDPVPNVQRAAITALGGIGGNSVYDFLGKIFSARAADPALRLTALDALVSNNLSGSLKEIEAVINADWNDPQSRILDAVCKRLSSAKNPALEKLFGRFLDSTSITIQIYGIRGIGNNGFTSLLNQVQAFDAAKMPDSTRAAAEAAIAKLK